mgnify:CR=1 FL=1
MMLLPKDYTQQEQIVAEVLSDFGIRYAQQQDIGKYTVDFWLPELNTIIEANGAYGHFGKRETERNTFLTNITGVKNIVYIKSHSKNKIKQILEKALCLE